MKQKFTRRREANRASMFHKAGSFETPSARRSNLRSKPKPKTFGMQIISIQRVASKAKNQFGYEVYKFIKHARLSQESF